MKKYPSGSKPAFIYGTPKINKLKYIITNQLSPRPIISSLSTYNYNLVKFIITLVEHVISTTHYAEYSFNFSKEIKKVRASNKFLVSYYVFCLFTSILLNETVCFATDSIFEKNSVSNSPGQI